MRQFLHRHKIVLNTLGPVFIGNGRELVKREYVLNKRERKDNGDRSVQVFSVFDTDRKTGKL